MEAIERFEKNDLRPAVPSNHFSKSIPDQFGAWKTNTNVARSSKLTNFQSNTNLHKIDKRQKDQNITCQQRCAIQVSATTPKKTLRQKQLVPLEYGDEHESGVTPLSALSPSPPRNKARRKNKTNAQAHTRKLRLDSQRSINNRTTVRNSSEKRGHIFPVVLCI